VAGRLRRIDPPATAWSRTSYQVPCPANHADRENDPAEARNAPMSHRTFAHRSDPRWRHCPSPQPHLLHHGACHHQHAWPNTQETVAPSLGWLGVSSPGARTLLSQTAPRPVLCSDTFHSGKKARHLEPSVTMPRRARPIRTHAPDEKERVNRVFVARGSRDFDFLTMGWRRARPGGVRL